MDLQTELGNFSSGDNCEGFESEDVRIAESGQYTDRDGEYEEDDDDEDEDEFVDNVPELEYMQKTNGSSGQKFYGSPFNQNNLKIIIKDNKNIAGKSQNVVVGLDDDNVN